MTIHNLVDRLMQLFSWLYYRRRWEQWELLTAAGAILLLLLWAAKKQRDERKARTRAQAIPQGPPIIGAKLAARNPVRADATDSKRQRLVVPTGDKSGMPNGIEPSAASSENTRTVGRANSVFAQAEPSLQFDQQLDELKAANERLQSQINEHEKTEQRLRRRMGKLLAAGKRLRQEVGRLDQADETLQRRPDPAAAQRFGDDLDEPIQARKHSKRLPFEFATASGLSRTAPNPQGRDEEMLPVDPKRPADSRRAKEPLDIEKLKAIAALARQIQSRPRQP